MHLLIKHTSVYSEGDQTDAQYVNESEYYALQLQELLPKETQTCSVAWKHKERWWKGFREREDSSVGFLYRLLRSHHY